MKRRYSLRLVLMYGSVLLTGFGCRRKLQEHPVQSMPWQVFASKEGGFSIDMPGAPEFQKVQGNGSKFSVNLDNHEQIYCAICFELPRSVTDKTEAQRALKAMAAAELEGQRVDAPDSQKSLSIQGNPGSEITFHAPNRDGGETVGTMQFVIRGTKLYEVAVLFTNGKGTLEDRKRFFNSFKIDRR